MFTAKRLVHTFLLAAFVFGLMFTLSGSVSARYSKPVVSSADCAFYETNFWIYSEKAGDAYNAGNYEDAQFYTQLASQQIDAARRAGCTWPGEVFPTT